MLLLFYRKLREEPFTSFSSEIVEFPRSLVTGDERRTVELDVGSIRWTNAASYSSSPEGTLLQRNVDEQVQWLEAKRPSSVAEPGPSNNRLDIVINIAGGSGRKPKASRWECEPRVQVNLLMYPYFSS